MNRRLLKQTLYSGSKQLLESKKKTADFCDMKVMYNCPFRIIVSFGSCYGTNRCLETVKTEPHPSESRLLKYTYICPYKLLFSWDQTVICWFLCDIYATCFSFKMPKQQPKHLRQAHTTFTSQDSWTRVSPTGYRLRANLVIQAFSISISATVPLEF